MPCKLILKGQIRPGFTPDAVSGHWPGDILAVVSPDYIPRVKEKPPWIEIVEYGMDVESCRHLIDPSVSPLPVDVWSSEDPDMILEAAASAPNLRRHRYRWSGSRIVDKDLRLDLPAEISGVSRAIIVPDIRRAYVHVKDATDVVSRIELTGVDYDDLLTEQGSKPYTRGIERSLGSPRKRIHTLLSRDANALGSGLTRIYERHTLLSRA